MQRGERITIANLANAQKTHYFTMDERRHRQEDKQQYYYLLLKAQF